VILTRAEGVVVEYDGRRALDGVSLTISAGQHVAVTGRSGSGKTTLMLVLAGLLRPTFGTVVLGGDPHAIVYVPQAPSLIEELSALDNVAIGLRVRGVDPPTSLARATAVLERLGVGDALEALPAELSGGMQQRVALARGLVVEPQLLLTDEPTGTLDRSNGDRVLAALRELSDQHGTALVVATHDPEVAAHFAGQIVLTDGRLAA
jgi:ABC-type lipoprotein export system ATPase subunit